MHTPPRYRIPACGWLFAALLFATPLRAVDDDETALPTVAPASEPASAANPTDVPATSDQKKLVENSVVKIFAQTRAPDPSKPWSKQSAREGTGSGMVIEGRRILTNAHVVRYANQIQVQSQDSGRKVSATVEAVGPGIDLAVLKLDDDSFFDTHPPLPRATDLPQIKDAVLVYGYPTGGTNLSITKGIVSRIEFTRYRFPVSGLRIQIDAAINPGNSGGPALAGDKVIGLAFSHLSNAQNIGYIIPVEEIDLFLKDVADGRYDGKPALYDEFQTLENSALRTYLKLDNAVEGMVVNEPLSDTASYPLKKWDLVTKIGDIPVDAQGMIKLDNGLRVRFLYAVQKQAKDGKVPLTVVRQGREMTTEMPVTASSPRLVPPSVGGYPRYFILGPMVFSTVSDDLMNALAGSKSAVPIYNTLSMVGSPLMTRRGDKPAFVDEELVFVPAPFFPHKLSKGYGSVALKVVKSVNNSPVKNLKHLIELVREAKTEFLVFEFCGFRAESLVFPRAELLAATDEILADNGIRAQATPEELAIWNAGKPTPPPAM